MSPRRQTARRLRPRGMALYPAMLFLLVLAILGVAALSATIMEERMAGNSKDQNLAVQAAEAGLRDAEADILANVTGASAFTQTCTDGLCTPPSTWDTPTSADISNLVDWGNPAVTRAYGSKTTAGSVALVAAQPVYVIEKLSTLPAQAGRSVGLGVAPTVPGGVAYRVTVRATGARAETRVILQSIYVVRAP